MRHVAVPRQRVADSCCGREVGWWFGLLLACSLGLYNMVNLLSQSTQVVWSHAQLRPLVVRGAVALHLEGAFALLSSQTLPSAENFAGRGLADIFRDILAR